jgi:hypothetical protein
LQRQLGQCCVKAGPGCLFKSVYLLGIERAVSSQNQECSGRNWFVIEEATWGKFGTYGNRFMMRNPTLYGLIGNDDLFAMEDIPLVSIVS